MKHPTIERGSRRRAAKPVDGVSSVDTLTEIDAIRDEYIGASVAAIEPPSADVAVKDESTGPDETESLILPTAPGELVSSWYALRTEYDAALARTTTIAGDLEKIRSDLQRYYQIAVPSFVSDDRPVVSRVSSISENADVASGVKTSDAVQGEWSLPVQMPVNTDQLQDAEIARIRREATLGDSDQSFATGIANKFKMITDGGKYR
jgi:hypothetical protein